MAFFSSILKTRRSMRSFGIFIPKVWFKTNVLASPSIRSAIKVQTEVSTFMGTRLLSHRSQGNVIFSPFSIHMVLSSLASACKDDRDTLETLMDFLHVDDIQDLNNMYKLLIPTLFADDNPNGGPILSLANGVWVEKSFDLQPYFKEVVETVYKGVFKQANFEHQWEEVANEVNLWVQEKTSSLVTRVLHPEEPIDIMWLLFINVLCFKGAWNQVFLSSNTENHYFDIGGQIIEVPFITNNEAQFVTQYNGFKVLGLQYLRSENGLRCTMYIYLPDIKDGLDSLLQRMSSTANFFDRHLPREKVQLGKFLIPRFRISHQFEVLSFFKNEGLDLLFSSFDGVLTETYGDLYLFNPKVVHEAYVEVNEEGTIAAAATSFMGEGSSLTEDYMDFVADHPFIFIIREDYTRVVLFMGKVVNPTIEVIEEVIIEDEETK